MYKAKISHYQITSTPVTNLSIKTELNRTKSGLDHIFTSQYQRSRYLKTENQQDPYRRLPVILREKYQAQNVTNAWLKFYELISEFNLGDIPHHFFFNAELPGAGISAVNHYMMTHKIPFSWGASSFVGEGAFTDKFKLWERYPKYWVMSDDFDGDMTLIKNILYLEQQHKDQPNFYFHDAGMDASMDYNNQELINQRLQFGCSMAGFLILKKGGTFIGKQFTMFEPLTLKLISFYSTLFEDFQVVKPLSSRSQNSEVYIVGQGYKGLCPEYREVLLGMLDPCCNNPLEEGFVFSPDLPEVQRILSEKQIQVITDLISRSKKKGSLAEDEAASWLKLYPIRHLRIGHHL